MDELEELTNRTKRTINRWMQFGKLPERLFPHREEGKQRYWTVAQANEIAQLLAQERGTLVDTTEDMHRFAVIMRTGYRFPDRIVKKIRSRIARNQSREQINDALDGSIPDTDCRHDFCRRQFGVAMRIVMFT